MERKWNIIGVLLLIALISCGVTEVITLDKDSDEDCKVWCKQEKFNRSAIEWEFGYEYEYYNDSLINSSCQCNLTVYS